jgi:FtsH-binding integral membrane protein
MECEYMSEEKQKNKDRISTRLDLSSKYWKTLLLVLAVFLTFAGPTYIVYVFLNVLEMDYIVSMVCGFALFAVGLVLVLWLTKKKVIS